MEELMSADLDKPKLELVPTAAADPGTIIGPLPVVVPDGEYIVRFSHWDCVFIHHQQKLAISFGIIRPDEYAGLALVRWYNVASIEASGVRNGRFEVGARSKLMADHTTIVRPLMWSSTLPLELWRDIDLRARVETVEARATGMRSSLIRTIERAE